MRSVVLEGEADRWQRFLSVLGEYGSFQPDEGVQTSLSPEQETLKARIDKIVTQVEAWTVKLHLREFTSPIAESLHWPRLTLEAQTWDALTDRLEARWNEYLPALERISTIDPATVRLFVGRAAMHLGPEQLERLDPIIDARRSLNRFATFLTILHRARLREVQAAFNAVGADARWEPLDKEWGFFLAFSSIEQRSTLLGVANQHQLIDADSLITSLHVLRFQQLVGNASRTIGILRYATRFGKTIRIAGYAPEPTLPVLEQRLGEIGFKVEQGQRRNFPVSTSLPSYVRNFDRLIAMYSTTGARYEEVDPTLAVAITFPLFFGFMFGDVGQGLILLALGAFLSYAPTLTLYTRGLWKYRDWGSILFLCGLASSIFGVLYGELFGFPLSLIGVTPLFDATETSLSDVFARLALVTIVAGFVQLTLGLVINVINHQRRGSGTFTVRPISIAITYALGFVYIGGATGFLPPLVHGFSYEPYFTPILLAIITSISVALIVEPLLRLYRARRDRQVSTLESMLEVTSGRLLTKHFSTVLAILPTDEGDRIRTELVQRGIDAVVNPYGENAMLLVAYSPVSHERELLRTVNELLEAARRETDRSLLLMRAPQDFSNVLFTVRNEMVDEVGAEIRRTGIAATVKALNRETSIVLAHCLPDRLEELSQTVEKYHLHNVVLAPYTREPEEPEGFTTNVVNYFIELIELASNTISYIRLAVLFLVHLLLMRVVNGAIALGLLGLPVIVLGNIGVTALEGLVVFIQSLRLHFYEFFSKFFQGGGNQYDPVTTTSRYARVEWVNRPRAP